MMISSVGRWVGRSVGVVTGAASALLLLGDHAQSVERVSAGRRAVPATFAKDVMPIVQQKCQVCHRQGSIAPMTLESYDDVVKAAPKIRSRILARTMPPWHLDKTIGIQDFKNDRSLTDDQLNTFVNWLDNGMPKGSDADMPAAVQWPDPSAWQFADKFGPPDLVVKSDPYSMVASGEDKWWRPTSETGLKEARWVRAIEIKPSIAGRKAVHHALTTLIQTETGGITGLASTAARANMPAMPGMPALPSNAGLFMEWAVGKTGEIYNENAGKLMMPDSKIRWEIHYYAPGVAVSNDVVELGIWFYPKGYVPKYRTILRMFDAFNAQLDIPPNSKSTSQNFYVLPAPARLENFQPHMHMRGKAMSMEAVYPDGHREMLSMVNNFQWRWHVNYTYADDAAPLLPKGTVLVFTAWHDNTADNPNNPDPNQWVGYGDRTVDEMAHAWVDVTYLEQEDYDRMVAERKATKAKGM